MKRACILTLLLIVACTRAPSTAEESTALLEDATAPEDHVTNAELSELFNTIDAAVARGDEQGEVELLEFSRHRDFLVRIRAVKGLSQPLFLNRLRAQRALIERLSDAHWLVRSFAAKGLGKSGYREAIAPLQARARSEHNAKARGFIEAAIRQLTE